MNKIRHSVQESAPKRPAYDLDASFKLGAVLAKDVFVSNSPMSLIG